MSREERTGGIVHGLKPVGEDGCTLYALPPDPNRPTNMDITFDASAVAVERLLEALRRALGSP